MALSPTQIRGPSPAPGRGLALLVADASAAGYQRVGFDRYLRWRTDMSEQHLVSRPAVVTPAERVEAAIPMVR